MPNHEQQQTDEQNLQDKVIRLENLGSTLQAKMEENAKKRTDLENRWLDDLRHYNGQYDEKTQNDMNAAASSGSRKSRVFHNITRPKTNAAVSRVIDIVVPQSTPPFSCEPSPVPYLIEMASDETPLKEDDGMPMITDKGVQVQKRDLATAITEQARAAADKMQTEIHDQLVECDYGSVIHKVIHDAGVFGTGILKGPVLFSEKKKVWTQDASGQYVLQVIDDVRPAVEWVDVWDYFPDMTAARQKDCEFESQRHRLSRKGLRQLINKPGFDHYKLVLAELLEAGPTGKTTDHVDELQRISGVSDVGGDKYEVWEIHIELEADDLIACGCEASGDDPFRVFPAIVWICQGKVINTQPFPMESESTLFSVFQWEEDKASMFGFGVPRLIFDSQRAAASSWRMVMDNGGGSVGPQIVVNRGKIQPADGSYEMYGNKVWYQDNDELGGNVRDMFATFNIPSNTSEFLAIFNYAKQNADDESAVPQLAQGEQGSASSTFAGMSLLMGSANVMLKRTVKNVDDDLIVPIIKKFIDWNMQFSTKSEIKGDLSVIAKGSSSLQIKERQTQNMITLMQMASQPQFAGMTHMRELYEDATRLLVPESNYVMSEAEIEASKDAIIAQLQQQVQALQQQAQQPSADPQPGRDELESQKLELQNKKLDQDKDIAVLKVQTDRANKQQANQTRVAEMNLKRQTGQGI